MLVWSICMNWLRSVFGDWRRSTARHSHHYVPRFDCLEERYQLSSGFVQTNLVSDVPGLAAVTDPNLINPWGVVSAPNQPFWISDANSGFATVYDDDSQTVPFTVALPDSGNNPGGPEHPTGIVFNGGSGFAVSKDGLSGSSRFL